MNVSIKELEKRTQEVESSARFLSGWHLKFVALVAFCWSLFQLWYASPLPFIFEFGVFIDVPARALHLGFALFLVFLTYPYKKQDRDKNFGIFSFLLSLIGFFCTLYIFFGYEGLVNRNGILLKNNFSILGNSFIFPTELIIGLIGIILLLEATRRSIGLPLVVVASIFYLYSYHP